MKPTPLTDRHVALGARMTDFGGWNMPLQYGPILEEVRRVRQQGGLFDLSHMGRLRIAGPQAVELCDRLLTNRIASMKPGQIRYGLLCRDSGMPLDDVLSYREEGDGVSLVVNASNAERDVAWIREHANGYDAQLSDHTDELAMLALQGPISEAVLQRVTEDLDLSDVGYYRFDSGTVCGVEDVRVSRTGYTGEDGFEVYLPAGESVRAWDELLAAGEADGLAPIGLGARDTLRLEAGMPLYGHEISDELNPIEAGLAFGVSFHKKKVGTLGFAALKGFRDAPTRRLVGLTTPGPRVPRQGHELFLGDEPVGFVCSGSVSPTLGTNVATGYVPLALAEPGTRLELDLRGRRQPLEVVELPFYSRS